MDWLRIFGSILGVVTLALLIGRMQKNGVESRLAWGATVVGSILLMLWLKGWIGSTLLLFAAALDGVEHIPAWLERTLGGILIAWFIWFAFNLIGNSILELAQELEKTKARMMLMEESIINKLNQIQRSLPDED